MLESIIENRRKYHALILEDVKDFLYRKKRYGVDFTLSIGICSPEVCMTDFRKSIRETDKFIQLEDNLCAVVFDGIRNDQANQALKHLHAEFQKKHYKKDIYIATATSDNYAYDGYQLVNSLLETLSYAVLNNKSHEIVDDYCLDTSRQF